MKEFTSTVGLNQTTKLHGRDSFKVSGSVTAELDNLPMMNEFHGEGVIISQDWPKGFQPVHIEDHVYATYRQDMEVCGECMALYLNCGSRV